MSEPTALEMLRTLWYRLELQHRFAADEIRAILTKLEAEQEVTKQLEELNRNLRIKTELDAGGGYPE